MAPMTSSRRFPPPWRVEQIPGSFKVLDASGQALVYVYARETKAEADIAKVLTFDEARRIAVNVAKLPELLGATTPSGTKKPRPKVDDRGSYTSQRRRGPRISVKPRALDWLLQHRTKVDSFFPVTPFPTTKGGQARNLRQRLAFGFRTGAASAPQARPSAPKAWPGFSPREAQGGRRLRSPTPFFD